MSFGRKLRAERESHGVSLASIAERTRVPERYLSALEQEQFEEMPGGVFNTGMLRSYCRDLGLDEEEWLDRYQAATTVESSPDLAEFAENVQRHRTDRPRSMGLRWLGVLLMLLALGALAWAAWRYVVQPRVIRPAAHSAQLAPAGAQFRPSRPA